MSALIFSKIPIIMNEIGYVEKKGKNTAQGYTFRGIEQLYAAVHPLFVKHGVFCAPEVVEKFTETYTTKNGSPAFRVLLTVKHFFYTSDGSSISVTTVGEGVDTSDKASSKAMSMAMKYAFVELFSIPTEDVADGDKESPTLDVGATKKEFENQKDVPVAWSGASKEKKSVQKQGKINEL